MDACSISDAPGHLSWVSHKGVLQNDQTIAYKQPQQKSILSEFGHVLTRVPALLSGSDTPMNESTFPHQLYEAAKAYRSSCTAYARFRAATDFIAVRIQAPEIMMQFGHGGGGVEFDGIKGRLFYHSDVEWRIRYNSIYSVFYYRGPESSVVVRVDFYVLDNAQRLKSFARFVGNAKESQLPPMVPGLGQGKWVYLEATVCYMKGHRADGQSTVYLSSISIHKLVHFPSSVSTFFTNEPGVLFFRFLSRLKDEPDDDGIHCVADYNSDRILFYPESKPREVVAQFLPNKPITNIGTGIVRVTWTAIDPPALLNTAGEDDAA